MNKGMAFISRFPSCVALSNFPFNSVVFLWWFSFSNLCGRGSCVISSFDVC